MLSMIEKRNNLLKVINKTKSILKSHSLLIGSLLVIAGISFLTIDFKGNEDFKRQEQNLIEEFLISEPDDIIIDSSGKIIENNSTYKTPYIAVIEIPSINLRSGMVDLASSENNTDKHIQILSPSDFPNVTNGNFILAGHSGSGRVAYFKNLIKVKKNDLVFIYYEGIKYIYQVVNIYNQTKNGQIVIHRDNNKTTLTLTTCHSYDKKKQLVVIAELIGTNTYYGGEYK